MRVDSWICLSALLPLAFYKPMYDLLSASFEWLYLWLGLRNYHQDLLSVFIRGATDQANIPIMFPAVEVTSYG